MNSFQLSFLGFFYTEFFGVFFPILILKISFHCLLACTVSDNSCALVLNMFFFLTFAFKIFFLSLVSSNFIITPVWFSCVYLAFLLPACPASSWNYLYLLGDILSKSEHILAIISSNIFSLILFPLSPPKVQFLLESSNKVPQVTVTLSF